MEGRKLDIVEWIDQFKTFHVYSNDDENLRNKATLIKQFSDGYCYFFARMLEEVFPGGRLVVPWPHGHFVYEYPAYSMKFYDIKGDVSNINCDAFIPLEDKYFGDVKLYCRRYYHDGVRYMESEISFKELILQYVRYCIHHKISANECIETINRRLYYAELGLVRKLVSDEYTKIKI